MEEQDRNNAPEEELQIEMDSEEELGDIGAAKAKVKKLRDELERVKKERQEYLDGWQRSKADSVNARKDMLREIDATGARKINGFVEDILPALDSFDMAKGSESWGMIEDGWRNGMENVQNQLLDALKRNGVERFGKVGDSYDPFLHEVAAELEDAPGESGSVARILRYGYRAGDRVIRPAQVILKK